jgi:hypothetical protein
MICHGLWRMISGHHEQATQHGRFADFRRLGNEDKRWQAFLPTMLADRIPFSFTPRAEPESLRSSESRHWVCSTWSAPTVAAVVAIGDYGGSISATRKVFDKGGRRGGPARKRATIRSPFANRFRFRALRVRCGEVANGGSLDFATTEVAETEIMRRSLVGDCAGHKSAWTH